MPARPCWQRGEGREGWGKKDCQTTMISEEGISWRTWEGSVGWRDWARYPVSGISLWMVVRPGRMPALLVSTVIYVPVVCGAPINVNLLWNDQCNASAFT